MNQPCHQSDDGKGEHILSGGDRVNAAVLVVEDDSSLADEMAATLRHFGLTPTTANDWQQALDLIASSEPDIIILDQRLGQVDTLSQLPRLRALTGVPVLVLTGNHAEADRVLALEIGADDFLIKPISGRELVARVRAHLRRASGASSGSGAPSTARPRWRLSLTERRLLRPNGTPVALTAAEFELLALLIETPNRAIDRDTLTRRIFGRPWRIEERAVDNLVLHLRQKLGPGGERSIATIRNQGYAFTAFPDP